MFRAEEKGTWDTKGLLLLHIIVPRVWFAEGTGAMHADAVCHEVCTNGGGLGRGAGTAAEEALMDLERLEVALGVVDRVGEGDAYVVLVEVGLGVGVVVADLVADAVTDAEAVLVGLVVPVTVTVAVGDGDSESRSQATCRLRVHRGK